MPKFDQENLDPVATISVRDPLVAVDRAVAEIRRGGFVVIKGGGDTAVIVQAGEATTPHSLDRFSELAGRHPILVLTPHRAAALGIEGPEAGPVLLELGEGSAAQEIRDIADPGAIVSFRLPPARTAVTCAAAGDAVRTISSAWNVFVRVMVAMCIAALLVQRFSRRVGSGDPCPIASASSAADRRTLKTSEGRLDKLGHGKCDILARGSRHNLHADR